MQEAGKDTHLMGGAHLSLPLKNLLSFTPFVLRSLIGGKKSLIGNLSDNVIGSFIKKFLGLPWWPSG